MKYFLNSTEAIRLRENLTIVMMQSSSSLLHRILFFFCPDIYSSITRTWLSNNLLYNNVEAQNVKKIRTFVATSSASENQKYNNISASCPTNNNFSLRFAIISVAFNCNMRRFWRRGGFFFCILVITTFCSLFWMVVLLYFIPTLDPFHSRESSERNGSTDILINRYIRRLMRKK